MDYLEYRETPVVEIHHPIIEQCGLQLLLKREDLNHDTVSGNKWWKLKYNIAEARRLRKTALLTFGGAFSNHINATAATARILGFKSIGVIRGEATYPLNPTLEFAVRQNMTLIYLSREAYRRKNDADTIESLRSQVGDFFMIPEGGTNAFAVRGTTEFAAGLLSTPFDYALLAVGTGGTIAGVIKGFAGRRQIVGVPVFKGGDYLRDEVRQLSQDTSGCNFDNWSLWTDYHHGGYAKTSRELFAFMSEIRDACGIPLDHVYTGKLLYAVFSEAKRGTFQRGTTLLAIHTGGLQGSKDYRSS